ncbi:MAG: hypothetical protein V1749_01020 [Candidatus Desantisbacteria bacterium]
MDMIEPLKKLLQDMVLPDLGTIKSENKEIKIALLSMNNRMNDINTHLVDQSRRIDQVRVELKEEIAKTNMRIDETNKRIDALRVELKGEIDDLRAELRGEIAALRVELKDEIFKNTIRIDEINRKLDVTNLRIDSLYAVIVRREEHEKLEIRMERLEQAMMQTKFAIQEKIAA